MLKVNNIEVIYSDVILVLKGLSMVVPEGQIVALLGANGAGKSTTLKAISGLLKSEEGEVTDGEILFGGEKINGKDPEEIVRKGIFQVMEGRKVFEDLTTEENLRCGAHTRKDQKNVKADYERVYTYFPRLKDRRKGLAGYLSGGEQQMLAVARILRTGAQLLLLDEISEGLAPVIVQALGRTIRMLREKGYTIVMVEQNFRFAAPLADRFYVMEHGRIVEAFSAGEMQSKMGMLHEFLGV